MKNKPNTGRKAAPDIPEFEVIMPLTRRAQVAETLRDLILAGKFRPGSQLVEQTLASRFGVSRGSIREAIWELIDQGIVTNRPYVGTFVIDIDVKTMEELYSVRGVLEQYCFREIWPHRTPEYIAEYKSRHAVLRDAIKAGDRVQSIKSEMHFHSYPYEFSQNGVLFDTWQQLSKKIQLSFAMSQHRVRDKDFVKECDRFLAAAIGDDLATILQEIERHLQLGQHTIHGSGQPA